MRRRPKDHWLLHGIEVMFPVPFKCRILSQNHFRAPIMMASVQGSVTSIRTFPLPLLNVFDDLKRGYGLGKWMHKESFADMRSGACSARFF